MESGKTLTQLESEVKFLGLDCKPSGKNGKFMKKDYIHSLMVYNLIRRYESLDNVPINLKFRLQFNSPQLACNYFDLKPKEQDYIWDNPGVWLTEKINGVRATLVFSKNGGYSLFSRDISDTDYIWVDYSSRVFDISIQPGDFAFVLDVEIQLGNQEIKSKLKELNFEVASDFQAISTLFMLNEEVLNEKIFNHVKKEYSNLYKFKLIDVYYWGSDIRKNSYIERQLVFDEVILKLNEKGIKIERPQYCKEPVLKKAFHEGIIKAGGEGTIAVYVDKPCNLTGSRKKDEMIKIKRTIFPLLFEENALTDTVDGWISHIQERDGLLHTVFVSVFSKDGYERKIAEVEAIPLSLRISGLLKNGTVVELSGSKWTEGFIEDPVIERVRFDKSRESCKLLL